MIIRDFLLEHRLEQILNRFFGAMPLLSQLLDCGETLVIGGALRAFKDHALTSMPRDIDFVVDSDEVSLAKILRRYRSIRNRFGGYKILREEYAIDIWSLQNTWAFREKMIRCPPEEYSLRLQETVFLNLDSIVYNLTSGIWFDDIYNHAMNARILDVVLIDNPQIALNIVRSILLKKKYTMRFSPRLNEIIKNYLNNTVHPLRDLLEVQKSHYKRVIIDSVTLERELRDV